MPTLTETLAALPADQRSARKAAWHLADVRPRIRGKGYVFTDGDLEITVTAASAAGKALTIEVEVAQGGQPVELVDEYGYSRNPFIFVNPPCGLWADGAMVETIADSFKAMVADAVRRVV